MPEAGEEGEDGAPVKQAVVEEEEAEEEEGKNTGPCAIVRIRVCKNYPEPVMDEDGNEILQQINEDELEEIPFEDRVLSLQSVAEGLEIWQIN